MLACRLIGKGRGSGSNSWLLDRLLILIVVELVKEAAQTEAAVVRILWRFRIIVFGIVVGIVVLGRGTCRLAIVVVIVLILILIVASCKCKDQTDRERKRLSS